ncbi:hypothetical protein N7513_010577 [Penicillium frequentans]|nr:hypothetical protein N7513_010577 [Penicillium glabrum]
MSQELLSHFWCRLKGKPSAAQLGWKKWDKEDADIKIISLRSKRIQAFMPESKEVVSHKEGGGISK